MTPPDDPIGTVRYGDGTLAVRARSVQAQTDDDLAWFIIDIVGAIEADRIDEGLIGTWPIVFTP